MSKRSGNKKGPNLTPKEVFQRIALALLLSVVIVAGIFYFLDIDPYEATQNLEDALSNLDVEGLFSSNSPSPTPQEGAVPSPAASEMPDGSDRAAGALPQSGKLSVIVIDVGQGDSILIQTPGGKNMLIDAGEKSEWEKLQGYLERAGVHRIDVMVATHPHSDHIGGMQNVVEQYEIGKIYMPEVTHTTSTYTGLLEAIQAKGLKITRASGQKKSTISLDDGVAIHILGPIGTEYDNLNNYSVVLRVEYGSTSFLFTGDAETLVEKEMLEKYPDLLDVDVLKVGHHGSTTSSSAAFLKAVTPRIALISCGEGNDYCHPSEEILKRLQRAGIELYRTDLSGSIAVYSNGRSLTVSTEKTE